MKKRILATIFTCFCLTFAVPAFCAKAEEITDIHSQDETTVESAGEKTIINPLYEDVISAEDLGEIKKIDEENNNIMISPKLKSSGGSYYDDVEMVVDTLRPELVGRREKIHLRYTQKGLLPDEWFDELLEEAFQESTYADEGDYLRWHVLGCEVYYEYFSYEGKPGTKTQNYFDITITAYYSTTYAQESTFKSKANQLLEEMDIKNVTSDYKKIKMIYDYICNNVAYDDEHLDDDSYLLQYSAYAALVNKKAVCQGYANLFYYLARKAGISTRIITGISYKMEHAWNIVKLENVYYNLDSTWDAGASEYLYFLKGKESFDVDHSRDIEYLTEAFQNKYPTPEKDYEGAATIASGTCGENINWKLNTEGMLILEGTGDMASWDKAAAVPWYAYRQDIRELYLDDRITSIGAYAFYQCNFYDELELPSGLTAIGEDAFLGCSGLKGDLIIPDSVRLIDGGAFYECVKFDSLKLSENLEEIGHGAFRGCNFTGELILPESVEYIGNSAFADCEKFTGELVLPKKLTIINRETFSNCTGFSGDLIIPDGVTEIDYGAFQNTDFDGKLIIPDSVIAIKDKVFNECNKLKGELNLPDNLVELGKYAFYRCRSLTGELVIPETITSIGGGAFNGCKGLTGNLIIPSNISEIPFGLFEDCSGFTGKLVIPETVKVIKNGAFEGCSGFTGELIIPDSVTMIESSAFAHCTGLTGGITIPESVTEIDSYLFRGCRNLTGELKLHSSIERIDGYAFAESCFTGKLIIPDGVKYIEMGAFKDCKGFTGDLILPDSITTVQANAFSGCEGLTGNLVLSKSMQKIEDYSFEKCYFTGDLIIPENIKEIKRWAFGGTKGLNRIIVKNAECVIDNFSATFPDNAVLVGYPQSTVQSYAKRNNRVFECYEHLWNLEKTIDKKPSCKETGLLSIHCQGCNMIQEGSSEILPIVDHNYKWIVEQTATKSKQGKKHEECEWCKTIRNQDTIIGVPKAELKKDAYTYDETDRKLTFVVSDSEGKKLEYGVDYVAFATRASNDMGPHSVEISYRGDYSGTVKLKYKVVPAEVTNFKAELSGGHDDVKLTWDKSTGATRYYVSYKKSSSSKYSSQKWTSKTSYTIKDLSDGVAYDFRVVPFYLKDDVKYYADSEYAYTSLETLKNVKAPSKVSALPYVEYNDVKVTWSKSTGAAGYNVYYKEGTSGDYVFLTSTTKRNTTDAVDLKDGAKYTFKVVPYYTDGEEIVESYYSKTKTIYILKQLDTPKVTKSSSKVKVQWNNISGESGYQISKSTSPTGTSIVSTYSTTSGKSKTISATKGKTYYYKVRAYKTVDGKKIPGPWSEVVEYTRK